MRGRKKRKQEALRTSDLKVQAREVAGHSGEALKEFAEVTGSAAKEFAGRTKGAAKDLVGSIEKAAKGVEVVEEPRRGRRFLKVTLALGIGLALLGNERVRNAISSALGRNSEGGDYPEVWRPDASPAADGEAHAAATAEGS